MMVSIIRKLLILSSLCISSIVCATSEEEHTIQIFERASPLVVNIHKINHVINPNLEFIPVETGSGSGFLWDKRHVVTNYHVIKGANEVIVTFKNGKTSKAKLRGVYPKKDIAVLTLERQTVLNDLNIPDHIPVADSSTLKVGQTVIAIGNPFGLDHTLTKGVISALNRQIQNDQGGMLKDLIQTDASINPGNSGGPLLNSAGELIGMNTAIYSTSGSSAGIGFAILSNDIKRYTEQLIQYGKVSQAGIGVLVFDDRIAQSLGIKGVLVHEVLLDSPAYHAGLHGTLRDAQGHIIWGDIITGINQHKIENTQQLLDCLETLKPGEQIKVAIIRGTTPEIIVMKAVNI